MPRPKFKPVHLSTQRDWAVIDAAESLHESRNYCPGIEEIARVANVSIAKVSDVMRRCYAAGYYKRVPGQNKAWEVVQRVPRPAHMTQQY